MRHVPRKRATYGLWLRVPHALMPIYEAENGRRSMIVSPEPILRFGRREAPSQSQAISRDSVNHESSFMTRDELAAVGWGQRWRREATITLRGGGALSKSRDWSGGSRRGRGPMDKAPAFEAGYSGSESPRPHFFFTRSNLSRSPLTHVKCVIFLGGPGGALTVRDHLRECD